MNASIHQTIFAAEATEAERYADYPQAVVAAAELEAARLLRTGSYRQIKQTLIEFYTRGTNETAVG